MGLLAVHQLLSCCLRWVRLMEVLWLVGGSLCCNHYPDLCDIAAGSCEWSGCAAGGVLLSVVGVIGGGVLAGGWFPV